MTPSPLRRQFLGWDRPALVKAATLLTARYRRGIHLDLGNVIVVVPGQRAGRRLGEILAFIAEDEQLRLTPPHVVTQSILPEKLYQPKRPFGNETVQDLAWAEALRSIPAEQLRQIVPQPPPPGEALPWLRLAQVLRRLHVELAADGLDFAAVLGGGSALGDFRETARWQALVALQRRYLELMDQQQLCDMQTARFKAVELREIHTDCDIILLGTADLNVTLRHMLAQVAARVTALIVAPESLADYFDDHGTLVPAQWASAVIPLVDDHLCQVDGPVEQAEAAVTWLANLEGRFRSDEVAIAVPDVSLVPQLQRQCAQCGVRTRWVEGRLLRETMPFRLLAGAAKFASHRRYQDLAELLRHPDVEDWLRAALPDGAALLSRQLDRFYNAHLPGRIRKNRQWQTSEHWPDLPAALDRIDQWLEEASSNHPLRQWGHLFRGMLSVVYGGRTLSLDVPGDKELDRAFSSLLAECDRLAALPESLDTLRLSAAETWQVVADRLAQETLPPPADPEAVEILGWLELPLDDSRAVLVTSFNEGYVPHSSAAEPFLPDRLRRALGLLHNERRYAGDAYAVSALCHSRENLRFLIARRDTQNNPLEPSRLVFACADEALVRRARKLFVSPKAPAVPRRPLLAPTGPLRAASDFKVPRPLLSHEPLQHISVTRFKAYLACPYRYYLRHVRKLKAVDDRARELDGSAFGILLHGALSALGRIPGAPRHSTRQQEILQFLEEHLRAMAQQRYGARDRRGAVRLQIEQARLRLRAFAAQQAALAQDGWRILYAEYADAAGGEWRVPFPVNGDAITLVGRIDRIDFHEAKRIVRILDYKTADRGQKPDQTHREGQRWIDLQLPLYRHLWRAVPLRLPENCAVELGYFNLPRQLDETDVALATWDDATLASADATAQDVIMKLRDGVFWPPTDPAPDYNEDLAAICLDDKFRGPLLGVDAL
jgi:hypothetical protein